MSLRLITKFLSVFFLVFSFQSANAVWVAGVDQFTIERNGVTTWDDDFSTDTSALYNNNLPVNVSGGKAQMNSRDGSYGASGISGRERWFGRMRQKSWLYDTDSFFVSSVFDITTPDAEGRYGMRLGDSCAICGNDDMLDLALYFDTSGNASIRYRYNNDVRDPGLANGFDFVQTTDFLNLTNFSQVSFFFRNAGDGNIEAGFLLLETAGTFDINAMADQITWFGTGYNPFNGENRVRAELINVEMAAVPETATVLMLLTGLLGLGFLRRRKGS